MSEVHNFFNSFISTSGYADLLGPEPGESKTSGGESSDQVTSDIIGGGGGEQDDFCNQLKSDASSVLGGDMFSQDLDTQQ